MPVLGKETTQSGFQVNQHGEPRKVFPTFTSYPMSRAFRPGERGSIFDRNTMVYTGPNAEEREQAMGYDKGATRAPTFSNADRCKLLGQAMDVQAVQAVWQTSVILAERGESGAPQKMAIALPRLPRPTHKCAVASIPDDPSGAPLSINKEEGEHDIWKDKQCIAFLSHGKLTGQRLEDNKIRKRAIWYKWDADKLYRFVKEKGPGPEGRLARRIVPRPDARANIIMTLHNELGHIGEKRTIHAVSQLYGGTA